jgi:hypothetical protein
MRRTTIEMAIDLTGERTIVNLGANSDRWTIHAIRGSDSIFRWSTLDALRDWIKPWPGTHASRIFPDDLGRLTPDEAADACALMVADFEQYAFFGYQGFDNFWGHSTHHREVETLIATLDRLRAEA